MKTIKYGLILIIVAVTLSGCFQADLPEASVDVVDATLYGLSVDNSGEQNSANLQKLIDSLADKGGTIFIPAGEYAFAENGRQTIGSHCIKMRSNVSIIGDIEGTVLKPVGDSAYGLDMFYFNDYLDTNAAVYLENCRFENFIIDACETSCGTYTSAGKGFMFNLFRNCHWKNVTVKNTDATGFGVDCPIDSTITNCVAINCGKAATADSGGASGFGIGFGYCQEENIQIIDCESYENKKFGFFFEHQGRFDRDRYAAIPSGEFVVKNCYSALNLYNFGGIQSVNTTYENCISKNARKYGFLFENSMNSKAMYCSSLDEMDSSFVIMQSSLDGDFREVKNIDFLYCTSQNVLCGVKVMGCSDACTMYENTVKGCVFEKIQYYTVCTSGEMSSLTLVDNQSDLNSNDFTAWIPSFTNTGNSWNAK